MMEKRYNINDIGGDIMAAISKNSKTKKKTNTKANAVKKPYNNKKKTNSSKGKQKNTKYKKNINKKPIKKVNKPIKKNINKTKSVKKNIKVKKVVENTSNTELLDKILEDSKQKKLNKKKKIVNKNQVKNKVVIDILKEESKKKKPKDNLIITREIDISDLQEYIEQESQIIEKSIDEKIKQEKQHEESIFVEEIKEKAKDKKKKKKKKKQKIQQEEVLPSLPLELEKPKKRPLIKISNVVLLVLLLLLFVVLIIIGVNTFVETKDAGQSVKKVIVPKKDKTKELEEEKRRKDEEFNECINELKNDEDTSEELVNYINDLNEYFAGKYRASIKYVELKHNFEYSYNVDKVYYAASTIKALDALYIYTKAASGEVNLDDTMLYTSKYNLASSYYMSKHRYGERISIRDLVKYAITRSDNRAHQMLVDYIGFRQLKEYGLSLGATKTLAGDIFGSINVDDAVIYWQEINRFINSNPELGAELKSYFAEADQNYLAMPENNISAIHKYGEYENYYHEIGIVYDENPYIIAILTTEGRAQFEKIIKDINVKIYELNNLYNSNRENICRAKIYK